MTTDPEQPGTPTDPAPTPTSHARAAEPAMPRAWLIGGIAVIALIFLARPILRSLAPAPRMEPALRLIAEGKADEAEAKLKEFLAYDPSNARARLTLADLLLNRDEPKPEEAKKTLEGFRAESPAQQAILLVLRGKAEKMQHRPRAAEALWKDALKLDPLVGEAGWLLLDLYYTERRVEEDRALALKLARIEPDPRDRVRLLLEPMRFDAEPLAAAGVIPLFKDVVATDPDDLYAALAYYRAKAQEGTGIEATLAALKELTEKHPDVVACWVGYLDALGQTGDLDGMGAAVAAMPKVLTSSPRIAPFRGRLAMAKRDYPAAIHEFQAALAADPSDRELYHRLSEAFKLAKQPEKADEAKAREDEIETARVELRGIKGREEIGRPGLFEEATGRTDLGLRPDPVLYKRLAAVRERMGHPDEALAWYRLVLKDLPKDEESLAAVKRLEAMPADRAQPGGA